ncbi:MAG: pilin [Patescibacteria group bacterium]|nr:pilin [Patescibacteria group bacterium]
MISKNYKIIISILLLSLFFLPQVSQAKLLPTPTGSCPNNLSCVDGKCSGTTLECNYTLDDILRGFVDFSEWLLKILGTIALLMFVVGGAMYLTSGGNEEKVKQGTAILKGTITGIIIALLAWTIVHFVLVILNVDPKYQAGLTGAGVSDACGTTPATSGYDCMELTSCNLPSDLDYCRIDNQCYRGMCMSNSSQTVVCCKPLSTCGSGSRQYCFCRENCLGTDEHLSSNDSDCNSGQCCCLNYLP